MEASYWIHDLSPYVIRFGEGVGLHWYGMAYAAGFVIAIMLLRLYHKFGRSPLGTDAQFDLLTYLIIGTLAGGRIGYMLGYRFGTFMEDPLMLFRVWEGGMASHGGIIGITVAIAVYAWRDQKRQATLRADAETAESAREPVTFLSLADLVCTLGPPGIFLGRIANFINGELWGRITDAPWAVVFPDARPDFQAEPLVQVMIDGAEHWANPRHPSQLYAAALEGLVLTAYLQWRLWKGGFQKQYPGQLGGEFLIAYAILRVLSEVYREPDAALILGLSRGVFYSLFLIVAGAAISVISRRRTARPA